MSTMDFVPPSIDYTSKKVVLPKTKYHRIPLNNTTSSSVTVGASTTQLLEFKIPPNTVFNFAKTIMQFSYSVPAEANRFSFIHENPEFQNIQLATAQNVILADVQNCHYSNHLLNKLNTKKDDIMSGSTRLNAMALPTPKSLEFTERKDVAADTLITLQRNLVPTVLNHLTNNVAPNDAVNQVYTDVLAYQVSTAANTPLTVQRMYELNHIARGTIMELDKDLCFMQELYLRCYISPSSKIAWTAVSSVPNNAPAAISAGNLTFQDIYLHLATESNMLIADSVRAKVSSGMTIQCPYLTSYRFGISAPAANSSVSANVIINLNASNGRRLKNILWSVFDGSESLNRTYCSSNASPVINNNKLLNYRTYLNNQPETDYLIELDKEDDWRENKRRLRGTLIGSTLTHYKYNWHHISRYGSVESVDDVYNDSNVVDGVDLVSAPVQYTIQATTGFAPANSYNLAGYSLYAFVETQKELTITPQGIVFA